MTPEEELIDAVEPKVWAVATAPLSSDALERLLADGWEPFSSYTSTSTYVLSSHPIIVLRKWVSSR